MTAFVELDRVGLQYSHDPSSVALVDTTMQIAQGSFAAVVGPSGCGKSSLMKLVTGLLPPTAGAIRVGGVPVTEPLKIVGMAFQNPTLLPWRTTLENILLPLEVKRPYRSEMRTDKARHVARAKELLAIVGLAGAEDKHPWMLSGGMQQRVNLCRALVHEPSLLMLDEPFGALDNFTREELWSVLQEVWMRQKFTCILVTHDLREAAFLADKVFVMSARPGHIVSVHDVPFPRARTLRDTFKPAFTDLVQTLREEIGILRENA